MSDETTGRLTTEERRESILEAATVVFGERGYHGATTDAIARQAGISQAYVVRMFGSKEELFVAAGARAVGRVADAFREVIAGFSAEDTVHDRLHALGEAYSALVADRGLLLTLMHFYSLGHDARFGPVARENYLAVYRIVRDEAGIPPDDAKHFFANGMLINVLVALRIPDVAEDDPAALELLRCAFEGKEHQMIDLAHLQPRLDASRRS